MRFESLGTNALRQLRGARLWKSRLSRRADINGHRIRHRGTQVDAEVIRQVIGHRDYDVRHFKRFPEIQRFYESCERPLIIDAGANIGASAVWFATLYPKATVVAIEPEPGNFELLASNVAGLPVRPLRAALVASPGPVQLFDPGGGAWAFQTGKTGSGSPLGEVEGCTVADLVQDGETPFILKIDIEGGEESIFENPPAVLAEFPIVAIELHDWMLPRGGTSGPFLRWHVSQDRDFVHNGENVFSLCNRRLPTL